WYSDNSGGAPHPVGQKGANGINAYDMTGNLFEWCEDWYADPMPATPPTSGTTRVLRGGSWYREEVTCAMSARNKRTPTYRTPSYGFRLACSSQ
ncbi:MAG: SUMF1/EgtB/PvdO family nonheme iron enzyme, partial [Prevotellaceae bacterium]|nr:SUMF1/EgtB/PvdO family nonheme iron enzyme [Prevotellaceae bacterium]